MRSKFWCLLTATSALSATTLAGGATAQVQGQIGVVETIVVTAKQREESLQDVPLSITAFTGEQLARFGVEDTRDLAQLTPNFNAYGGFGRQDATALNIRGVSANTADERYQPVSFFADGIYLGGITIGLQVLDVERVEVIKGPQSATFGRATYSGAVDFITSTPSLKEFSGRIGTEISSNTFDNLNYNGTAYVEGPLIEDKLSGSLFYKYQLTDGFDQALGSPQDEIGQEETNAISGTLFAQLTLNTSLKLRGIYAEEDDQAANLHNTHPLYWQQQGANVIVLPNNGALYIDGAVPNPIRDGLQGQDLQDPPVASPADGGYNRERFFASAVLEHDLPGGGELSYRGGYLNFESEAYWDFRGRTFVGTDPVFGPTQPLQPGESAFSFSIPLVGQELNRDTSHQLRYLSPEGERLSWRAGLYYYWSLNRNFGERSDRTPPAGNEKFQSRGDERIINYAAFGGLAFDFTDQLALDLEGRLSYEEVQFDGLPNAVSSGSRINEDLSEDRTEFDPRITIEYQASDNQLLYALFSRGTKSGRFNTSTTAPFLEDGTRPASAFLFADPEELLNYEVGSKSTFLDGRAQLNFAAFYQDVENQQLRQTVLVDEDFNGNGQPDDILNQVVNAGGSRAFGFEFDGVFRASEALTLRGALGYVDQEFVDEITPPADGDLFEAIGATSLKGKTSLNVPALTGTLGTDYQRAVLDGAWDFRVSGEVNYTDKRYVDLANIAYIDDFFITNVRSSLENDNFRIGLFINNLFDDETAQGSGLTNTASCEFRRNGPDLPVFVGAQNCIVLVPQRGQEIGVNASVRF